MNHSKLDKMIVEAKKFTEQAGDKAAGLALQAKLRIQLAQSRSDLDSCYMRLGEIIYELQRAGTENDRLVNACIAEIEARAREMDELSARLDAMRDVHRCPECMAENQRGALFCARCGASLRSQTIVSVSGVDADNNDE